jgi:ribosomal protein L11 methyltransferase
VLVEITLQADEVDAEPLADALLDAGALAVTVEDAHVGSFDEHALFGEPGSEPARCAWPTNRLRVLVDGDAAALLAAASSARGITPPPIESTRDVGSDDWVRTSQAQFAPTKISDRLWIVPSWHEPPDPNAIVIRLDPGRAFGTGTHPTTRLVLAWLDQQLTPGATVLDVGCGSGILAIAAAKLGAGRVTGTDIDPHALAAARGNSAANGIDAHYTDPDSLGPGIYDVVLANILANPLKLLAPALGARVAPGGALVLSGILERQADELIAMYRAAVPEVPLTPFDVDDGWVCLAGRRAA